VFFVKYFVSLLQVMFLPEVFRQGDLTSFLKSSVSIFFHEPNTVLIS